LLSGCALGLLVNVDNLKVSPAFEFLVANAANVSNCIAGTLPETGYVQAQPVTTFTPALFSDTFHITFSRSLHKARSASTAARFERNDVIISKRACTLRGRPQIQSNQRPMRVGKISNNLFHRFGQFTHEGRDRNDLVTASQLGLAQQIDNLDGVSSWHVLFAKGAKIINQIVPDARRSSPPGVIKA
jgi:hypothetical protein